MNKTIVSSVVSPETKIALETLAETSGESVSKIARFILEAHQDDLKAVCFHLGDLPEGSPERLAFHRAILKIETDASNRLLQSRWQMELERIKRQHAECVAELGEGAR